MTLTYESVYTKAIDAAATIENYAMDAVMELDMSVMGQEASMITTVVTELDGDKMYVLSEMDMGELGTQSTESYVDMENLKQYVAVEGEWYVVALDAALAEAVKQSQSSAVDYMSYMSVENGTVEEKEYEGVPCYEIAGVIDLDFLEAIEKMNLDSVIGDTESMGLPANFFEDVFKDVEPFVLVMGIDKETYLPVYGNMDMTEMMNALMSSVMDYALEISGEEVSEDINTSVSTCIMTYAYRDIGEVAVVLPENAIGIEM